MVGGLVGALGADAVIYQDFPIAAVARLSDVICQVKCDPMQTRPSYIISYVIHIFAAVFPKIGSQQKEYRKKKKVKNDSWDGLTPTFIVVEVTDRRNRGGHWSST